MMTDRYKSLVVVDLAINMPVIGINLRKIEASIDEKKPLNVNINVNSSPKIENVERSSVDLLKDILAVDFTFTSKYEPDIAEMLMEGQVLYQTDKAKEVLNLWKKEKKLEDGVALDVLNAIFRKCLTRAVDLSAELRLPPPVQFPVVKPKE